MRPFHAILIVESSAAELPVSGRLLLRTDMQGHAVWNGVLLVPVGQFILPGAYLLKLENGRAGRVVVQRAVEGKAVFEGIGALE